MPDTHVVTNQVPPLTDYNPATSPVLMEALIREGGGWGVEEVTELGALSGMSVHGVSKAVQRMSVRLTKDKKLNRSHRKVMLALEEKG